MEPTSHSISHEDWLRVVRCNLSQDCVRWLRFYFGYKSTLRVVVRLYEYDPVIVSLDGKPNISGHLKTQPYESL